MVAVSVLAHAAFLAMLVVVGRPRKAPVFAPMSLPVRVVSPASLGRPEAAPAPVPAPDPPAPAKARPVIEKPTEKVLPSAKALPEPKKSAKMEAGRCRPRASQRGRDRQRRDGGRRNLVRGVCHVVRRGLPLRLLRRTASLSHRRELVQARVGRRNELRRLFPRPALRTGHGRQGGHHVGRELLRPGGRPRRVRREPAPASAARLPERLARRASEIPIKGELLEKERERRRREEFLERESERNSGSRLSGCGCACLRRFSLFFILGQAPATSHPPSTGSAGIAQPSNIDLTLTIGAGARRPLAIPMTIAPLLTDLQTKVVDPFYTTLTDDLAGSGVFVVADPSLYPKAMRPPQNREEGDAWKATSRSPSTRASRRTAGTWSSRRCCGTSARSRPAAGSTRASRRRPPDGPYAGQRPRAPVHGKARPFLTKIAFSSTATSRA